MTLKINVRNYIQQSVAADDWLRDVTDRLLRSGARQVGPDMFDMSDMTPEELDKYILETVMKKDPLNDA